MPGYRRTYRSKAAAYRALAVQLLTRKYTTVDDFRYEEHDPPRRMRSFTERGFEMFGSEWENRDADRRWSAYVERVARRLRMRDEHRSHQP